MTITTPNTQDLAIPTPAKDLVLKPDFHKPLLTTKDLALNRLNDGTYRFRNSTNFARQYQFNPGARFDVKPAEKQLEGFSLVLNSAGKYKVHERDYGGRRGLENRFETVVEIADQSFLRSTVPAYTERVQVLMQEGRMEVKPLKNRVFSIRKAQAQYPTPLLTAVAALTSGIDVHCLEAEQFELLAALEKRPSEARDIAAGVDKSESGVLSLLHNAHPKLMLNQDIYNTDFRQLKDLVDTHTGKPVTLLHLCPQCDDYSKAKSPKEKERSQALGNSTRDMVYPLLKCIEELEPACVFIENVPDFGTSGELNVLKLTLRRWGYHVSEAVLSATVFEGNSLRKRYFLVASVYPGFEFPQPVKSGRENLYQMIEDQLPDLKDITENKAIKDGAELGWLRVMKPDANFSPTIIKSQSRGAKDTVVIQTRDGRYMKPSIELLRLFNELPASIDLSCLTKETQIEVIGQSISYSMHTHLVRALKAHLQRAVMKFS